MNPTKITQVEVPVVSFQEIDIASTEWFNAAKKEPGQPGVFEVNPVQEFENEPSCRRFSYWNGKAFGPIASNPEKAHDDRFGKSGLGHTITAFRGLSEQA